MAKIKRRSRILKAVQDTAQDLVGLGFIRESRMKKYGVQHIPLIKSSGKAKIRAQRK
jgi:hypothetical protein